ASGGTLFLDEIGELPLTLQVKLLRLLESSTYRRVGGLDTLGADFRLVAATHRDLAAMVRNESFRRDLYYRINTFPIHTPPLAERREDIPLLAESLLERVDSRPGRRFSADALAWLSRHPYEGNIRELRNLIERAALMTDGDEISAAKLTEVTDVTDVSTVTNEGDPIAAPAADAFTLTAPLPLAQLERRYLAWLTATQGSDVRRLAPALGISERTLYRKLRDLEQS
ncbi:MAG TPA: sigma 54-interacting transcriptional regulator, partial [Azospira sp.]|nr:sigma 54-interacting transcriptional regulator [Azospira sp.]